MNSPFYQLNYSIFNQSFYSYYHHYTIIDFISIPVKFINIIYKDQSFLHQSQSDILISPNQHLHSLFYI